jgi:hypothetical protein
MAEAASPRGPWAEATLAGPGTARRGAAEATSPWGTAAWAKAVLARAGAFRLATAEAAFRATAPRADAGLAGTP